MGRSYRCIGILKYFPNSSSTIEPVFDVDGDPSTQIHNDSGYVKGFCILPEKYLTLFQQSDDYDWSVEIGEKAIVGFVFSAGSVVAGNEFLVRKGAAELLGKNSQAPFFSLEVAQFCGNIEVEKHCVDRCFLDLCSVSYRTALQWLRYSEISQPVKEELLGLYTNKPNSNVSNYQGIVSLSRKSLDDNEERASIDSVSGKSKNALPIYEKIAAESNSISELTQAFMFFVRTDDLVSATKVCNRMIKITVPKSVWRGIAYGNRASALMSRGKFDKAEKDIQRAEKIYKDTGQTENLGSLYGTRAISYIERFQYGKARTFAIDSLRANKEAERPSSIAQDYNNLGLIHRELGGSNNLAKSQKYYEAAIELNLDLLSRGDLTRRRNLGNNYAGLSITYYKLGLAEQGRVYVEHALEQLRLVGAENSIKQFLETVVHQEFSMSQSQSAMN